MTQILIYECFTALKGIHFWFLFAFTARVVVQCGCRKTSPYTSTTVQFIFNFWSFEISWIFWEIRTNWLVYTHILEKLIDTSRESHNHKPQPTPDTKRKRKWHKLTCTKQMNKCTRNTQTSSLFPKRGDHNAKRNDAQNKKKKQQKTGTIA